MSLLDQAHKLEQQVVARLKELEPLTREYDQLRKLAERLGLKYSPGSKQSGDGVTAATKPRRPAKRTGAAKRAARRPAKAKPAQPRASARATKPAAKSRGGRSTTATQTSAPAKATGANGKAAAGPRKRTATSGQRSSRRRSAAPPGQRNDDVLRLVRENPGITVREIGERLGVDATGLYRVINRLTDDGRLRKQGTRLQAVDGSTPSEPSTKAAAGTPSGDS